MFYDPFPSSSSSSVYEDGERTPTQTPIPPHSPILYNPPTRLPYPFNTHFSREPTRVRAVFDAHVQQAQTLQSASVPVQDSTSDTSNAEAGASPSTHTHPPSDSSPTSGETPTPKPHIQPRHSSSSSAKLYASTLNLTIDVPRAKRLHWRSIQARQPVVLTARTPPATTPRHPVVAYPSAES